MAKQFYPAFIHKDADSDFGISFPDVPGCISAGSTLEECLMMGEEALNGYLDWLVEDGDPIPRPSTLEEARAQADPEDLDALVTIQMIPRYLPGRTARISLTMDEDLLKRIDADAGHYGRSGWLADAAKMKLAAGSVPDYQIPASTAGGLSDRPQRRFSGIQKKKQ